MKKWSNAFKRLLNDNFGSSIGAEWSPYWINCEAWKATPYVKTTDDGTGLLTPEQWTTPGWSGANQIPLKVNGNMVTVDFQPIGKNMSCQLCYRAVDGSAVYSIPATSGKCSLRLDKAPNKNVVIAVVCNTDYKYLGEETRKAHYDYRLKLVEGLSGAADIYTKWYDMTFPAVSATPISHQSTIASSALQVRSVVDKRTIVLDYLIQKTDKVTFLLISASGKLLQHKCVGMTTLGFHTSHMSLGSNVVPGYYVVEMSTTKNGSFARSVVVK
jgi:hypothetical protein